MDGDRQRLAERAQLEVDLLGKTVKGVFRHRDVLAQAPRDVDPVAFARRAEVIVAGSALRARQAHDEQFQRDAVAGGPAGHAFAEASDLARALVAEHEAGRYREVAAVEVQIATTHADVAHAYENLAGCRLRPLDILDLERARTRDHGLLHA